MFLIVLSLIFVLLVAAFLYWSIEEMVLLFRSRRSSPGLQLGVQEPQSGALHSAVSTPSSSVVRTAPILTQTTSSCVTPLLGICAKGKDPKSFSGSTAEFREWLLILMSKNA